MGETPHTSINGAPGAVDSSALCIAAWVLKIAGLNVEEIVKALREIYGIEIEADEVKMWLTSGVVPKTHWENIVLETLQELSKEKLAALRYATGAAIGDAGKDGRLRVKDADFAHAYAEAVRIITGTHMSVKQRADGRYDTGKNRVIAYIVNSGLWKAIAYIDRYYVKIGPLYFLAGLVDAEGAIIPLVDRTRQNIRVSIMIANTNLEIVKFATDLLKDLGFKLHIKVVQPGYQHVKGGEVITLRKTLYKVYVNVAPDEAVHMLKRLPLHCRRKRQLLQFFIATANLPPRQRFEEFMRHWQKKDENSKWEPVGYGVPPLQQPKKRTRRKGITRAYVKCPKCWQPGTFELRKTTEGTIRVWVGVTHKDGRACVLYTTEREVKKGEEQLVECGKCGELGYLYARISLIGKEGKYCYPCVRVEVTHNLGGGKKKNCLIAALRLAETAEASRPQSPITAPDQSPKS